MTPMIRTVNLQKFLKVKKIHWHLQGFNFKRGYFSIYFYEIVNGKPSTNIPHKKINSIILEQKKSLDRWIKYFISEDTNCYPMWFKYYVFQNIVKIGFFEKNTHFCD